MHIFNAITGGLLVVSPFIKANLHDLHDRKAAKSTKRGSYNGTGSDRGVSPSAMEWLGENAVAAIISHKTLIS